MINSYLAATCNLILSIIVHNPFLIQNETFVAIYAARNTVQSFADKKEKCSAARRGLRCKVFFRSIPSLAARAHLCQNL